MSVSSVAIIGGGISGFSCARELRAGGFTGELTIIDPEGLPYDRPPLSKELLTGEFSTDDTLLAPASWYEDNNVEIRTDRADRIEPDTGRIVLESGAELTPDAIVLAVGGRARRLSIPGGDLAEIVTLRTKDDALALKEKLTAGTRVAIIGAGLIGAEVASTAVTNGCEVTLIDPAPVPLVPAVGHEIAEVLHAMHAERGITCFTGLPTQIRAEGGTLAIDLDGAHDTEGPHLIEADLVLVAIGIDTYSPLAASAELEQEGGILVDAGGRTSNEKIWAIGDVARLRNEDGSLARRHEHWESAANDGKAAAASILGQDPPTFGSSWFWSDRHGVHVEGIGSMTEPGHTVIREKDGKPQLAFRIDDDGKVIGAVAIDGGMAVRAARRIIDRGKIVDPADLANPDIDLKKLAR
ncbi:ferredoxin-NAD reductase [Bowdeniella nasicola]|uniref:Ferredoxin-NAD reductase n=1 Tax=Bowdeniella nasicola TaxID=208480 RepID=A0A1Q5PZX8_9ACTO|nr:FAD-dependent oxidoreductase [Bowdeniella nasicola]OKL53087.1 ferredoxin-NAD reductase [Bowdeniella nasicola]